MHPSFSVRNSSVNTVPVMPRAHMAPSVYTVRHCHPHSCDSCLVLCVTYFCSFSNSNNCLFKDNPSYSSTDMNTQTSADKKRSVLHSQGREIVHNVYQFFKRSSEASSVSINILERTAEATGISRTTVKRIVSEARNKPAGSKFVSPGKTIEKSKPKSVLADFDETIIRNIIYNYAAIHKKRPTMQAVLQEAKRDGVEFTGQITTFRAIVRKLGFRWKKTQDNKKLLTEKTEIRTKRIQYLRQVRKYRKEGWNVVYNDETYIHSSHTVPHAWDDDSLKCLKAPITKGQRLIIVHCGGSTGFIPNALLMFKSGRKTGDYHDDMNHKNYIKYLEEKVIPNLKEKTVLVIDNASYHNVCVEPSPTTSWKKDAMQKWLAERNITYGDRETKPELYAKILIHKPKSKLYAVDKLMSQHGHRVLRLPPYHPELNPIEKVWASVKNKVAACNVTFKLDDVWKLAEEKFEGIQPSEWESHCNHAIKIEEEYVRREYILDDVEDFIININSDSDESCSSEDEPQESDDDLIGINPL